MSHTAHPLSLTPPLHSPKLSPYCPTLANVSHICTTIPHTATTLLPKHFSHIAPVLKLCLYTYPHTDQLSHTASLTFPPFWNSASTVTYILANCPTQSLSHYPHSETLPLHLPRYWPNVPHSISHIAPILKLCFYTYPHTDQLSHTASPHHTLRKECGTYWLSRLSPASIESTCLCNFQFSMFWTITV